jgi:uracil-DNA glycosylase family 4
MSYDLSDLYEDYRQSKHFKSLRHKGARLIEGTGPTRAPIKALIVGEAPGSVETDSGKPFTGKGGKVLTQLLASAGFMREDVYLTYAVKYRPPGGRQPTGTELMRSQKFLRKEWMMLRPRVTIALGDAVAACMEVEGLQHGILNPFWYDDETSIMHLVAHVYSMAFGIRYKQSRAWVEKEWALLGEEIREHAPKSLCQKCFGGGPRGKVDCHCSVPF